MFAFSGGYATIESAVWTDHMPVSYALFRVLADWFGIRESLERIAIADCEVVQFDEIVSAFPNLKWRQPHYQRRLRRYVPICIG